MDNIEDASSDELAPSPTARADRPPSEPTSPPSLHGGELDQPDEGRWRKTSRSDRRVAALLDEWVTQTWPKDARKRVYFKQEVEDRLASYARKGRWWRVLQLGVWGVILVLGLLISVLAGFKTGHGFTIVAGALVATLTTLTNALHPSKLADGYEQARLAIRAECWSFLDRRGTYAELDDDAAYAHFEDAIAAIVATKRTLTSLDSAAV